MPYHVYLNRYIKPDVIIYYLLVFTVALGLKFHYSRANSDDLRWILAPTAGLCQLITSIEFEHETGSGYISRAHRIIIAPACAGVNFMIAAFVLAAYAPGRRDRGARVQLVGLIQGLGLAYLATVLVNALRIVIAIYLIKTDFEYDWLTPERIHRLEGIVVYFTSLLVFYGLVHKMAARRSNGEAHRRRWMHGWAPYLTYSAIVLGIPLLKLAWRDNPQRFTEHLITVAGVSLLLSLVLGFAKRCRRSGNIS